MMKRGECSRGLRPADATARSLAWRRLAPFRCGCFAPAQLFGSMVLHCFVMARYRFQCIPLPKGAKKTFCPVCRLLARLTRASIKVGRYPRGLDLSAWAKCSFFAQFGRCMRLVSARSTRQCGKRAKRAKRCTGDVQRFTLFTPLPQPYYIVPPYRLWRPPYRGGKVKTRRPYGAAGFIYL